MDNTITVTDMYFVAALFAYGADYAGVDRTDKKNQKFHFKSPLQIEKIHLIKHGVVETLEKPSYEAMKSAYDTSTLMYTPAFVEALRRVKGIIHA